MVQNIVKQTIARHNLINRGEHIVIGLSGGPDSVCLFHVLRQLQKELDFALYAVHVNHQFRPGAAEADQAYVESLCEKEGIVCVPFVYDCSVIAKSSGMSSEEAGRKVRYEAFGTVAQLLMKNGIAQEKVKVAVAQNANDQAETVLLRLLRGTGPDGLAGMAYCREEKGVRIIRPLLDTWRPEIEAYCETEHLQPRIDQTNLEPVYTRNKVRLQLIPYLEEQFNENISEALIRLSKIAAEDKDYLWKSAEAAYGKLLTPSGGLALEGLRKLEPSIRHRVMLKAFEKAGLKQDLTAGHLAAADQLLEENKTSRMLDFPNGYFMELRYGEAHFQKKGIQQKNAPQQKEASHFMKTEMRLESRVIAPNGKYPKDAAVFDWDQICAEHPKPQIRLRTRQPGDYIRLQQGRKKLQDFFIDQKLPKEQREQVPVVSIGSEILWIAAGHGTDLQKSRYSEKYRLVSETKNALVLEIICAI